MRSICVVTKRNVTDTLWLMSGRISRVVGHTPWRLTTTSPDEGRPSRATPSARARQLEQTLIDQAKTEAQQVQVQINKTDWGAIATSVRVHMKSGRVNVAAQAFAYRWFLSIFPTIIALLGVATLVTLPQSVVIDLIHGVTRALPSGASNVFTKAITHATHNARRDLIATIVASRRRDLQRGLGNGRGPAGT